MMDKRSGDPFAWQCLDDEQREIIHEWYEHVSQSDKKEWSREKRIIEGAGYFAMLPLATGLAWDYLDGKWWEFLLAFGGGYLGYAFVFYVFSEFYYHFNYRVADDPPSTVKVIFQSIVAIFVTMFILSIIR